MKTALDPRSTDEPTDCFFDTALPAALFVAAASWLPVGVLLLGYVVRVVRAELQGDDALPTLKNVRTLATTGLRAAAVVVAFQLPILGCLGLVFALWYVVDHGRFYGDAVGLALTEPVAFLTMTVASPGSSLLVVAGLVLTGVVAVIAGYLGTLALVTFAATDRLTSAFDTDVLAVGLRSGRFRRSFLLASVLGFLGSSVAGLVAFVPVVGPFVGAFVELFVLVGVLRLVAGGYDHSVLDDVQFERRPDSDTDTRPRSNSTT